MTTRIYAAPAVKGLITVSSNASRAGLVTDIYHVHVTMVTKEQRDIILHTSVIDHTIRTHLFYCFIKYLAANASFEMFLPIIEIATL